MKCDCATAITRLDARITSLEKLVKAGRRSPRTCRACGAVIYRHDKYRFDGRVLVHRDCQDPESYPERP